MEHQFIHASGEDDPMPTMVSQSAADERCSQGHELALRRLGHPVTCIDLRAHCIPKQAR